MAAPSMPSFSIGTITHNSISVSWGSVAGATGYRLYLNGSPTWSFPGAGSFTHTNLTPDTTYTLGVSAYNQDGESDINSQAAATLPLDPPPPTPHPLTVSTTSTTITLSWGASTNANGYRVYLNNVFVDSTTNLSYTFTNLLPDTTYGVGVEAYRGDLTSPRNSAPATTKPAGVRPDDFQWQYSQTVLQEFVPGTDANHAIHRDDWNNLTNRINQFRDYKGLPVVTFTIAFYDMVVTASVFNELRNAIVEMVPPNPPTGAKEKGDIINAAHISGLRHALNSIP